MSLFKRKVTLDVRVVSVGDIVLVNGNVYRVEYNALQQLPVNPITKLETEEN